VSAPTGGTIGLLAHDITDPLVGSMSTTPQQRAGIHVELTTDNLDALYEQLKARGVELFEPPHDEPWERSMRAHDPDGTPSNSPRAGVAIGAGLRAHP
jgi:Glyoxalase/Bleomycin resistance protein/Dioxygenase superfamily